MRKVTVLLLVFVFAIGLGVVTGCAREGVDNSSSKAALSEKEDTAKLDLGSLERENLVGKSNKDFKDLTKSKPTSVKNDATKKWRMVTISEPVDINEYLLSYNKLHMKDVEESQQVHIIFNFATKTTTMINDFGSFMDVRTHEYVAKEEHDAKKIGSGMLLGNYWVYKDNGDIEKIK